MRNTILNNIKEKMKCPLMYQEGDKYDFEVAIFNEKGECLWFKGYSNLIESIDKTLNIDLTAYPEGCFVRVIYVPAKLEDFGEWLFTRKKECISYNQFDYEL